METQIRQYSDEETRWDAHRSRLERSLRQAEEAKEIAERTSTSYRTLLKYMTVGQFSRVSHESPAYPRELFVDHLVTVQSFKVKRKLDTCMSLVEGMLGDIADFKDKHKDVATTSVQAPEVVRPNKRANKRFNYKFPLLAAVLKLGVSLCACSVADFASTACRGGDQSARWTRC